MYAILRPLLFSLEAERAHDLAVGLLALVSRHRLLLRTLARSTPRPGAAMVRRVMGLEFPHPIGLAAGLDKDARAFPALAALGFSWVELGTVTPEPQAGNPKPRLFRLSEDGALINRMGFNSSGLTAFVRNLQLGRARTNAIVGVNIGKNAVTPVEHAVGDYLTGLQAVYPVADYVAINISSPNTEALRDLQGEHYLGDLLERLSNRRDELAGESGRSVPLALKIAPDMDDAQLRRIAQAAIDARFDALIATNTTTSRPGGLRSRHRQETGGLSGAPLRPLATHAVSVLHDALQGRLPIIGVGGVANAAGVREKLAAGADLVQLYTSFIYQGPSIVRNILAALER